MMRINKAIIVVSFILIAGFVNAQLPDLSLYKTIEQRLDTLKAFCERCNKEAKYSSTVETASYALSLCPEKPAYCSAFNFYLGDAYEDAKPDTAIRYYEKSLGYARTGNDAKMIRKVLEVLLYHYSNYPNYTGKRNETVAEILKALDTTRSDEQKSEFYPHLADYYGITGEHEKAIHYLLLNLGIAVKRVQSGTASEDDKTQLGVAYANIGEKYMIVNQPAKGLEYTKQAGKFLINYPLGMAHYYKDLTDAYLELMEPSLAHIYHDSLEYLLNAKTSVTKEWYTLIAIDLNFADYYTEHGHVDSALTYVYRAHEMAEQHAADNFMKAQVNYMLGKTLATAGQYSKGLPALLAAEPLSKDWGMELYADLLMNIAKCYGGLRNYAGAYAYYERYTPLRDSLYNQSAKRSAAEAEAKFQNKQKQQEIESQRRELSVARMLRVRLIAALLLAGLVAMLLTVIYRNKKRTADALNKKNRVLSQLNDELDEANQTKAKLFSIISHDLRSPVSQVHQFLRLQQVNSKFMDEAQRTELRSRIQRATGSLLETMEDLLVWSKTQMKQFTAMVVPVDLSLTIDQCVQLLLLDIQEKEIRIAQNVPAQTVIHTDPYYVQTIIRNLLNNAIKASPAGAYISFVFTASRLSITNQGLSFTQREFEAVIKNEDAKGLSGLGLKLVDELARKIGVVVSFSSSETGGTTATMSFPDVSA